MTFDEKVYFITKQIPKGSISTYKEIGKAIGTKAYRAIGQVLAVNPYAPEVPCHRVVKSDGKLGGFFGGYESDNINRKIRLLESEGIQIKNGSVENFHKTVFKNFKLT